MKKILLAVDASRGSSACVETCARVFSAMPPKEVILLHVEQVGGGPTLMHDRISDAEMETLKEELEGTEALETMQETSREILATHRNKLKQHGFRAIKTVAKTGHVAEEILKTAHDQGAELIIIGNTRSLVAKLMMGDVAKEVANHAEVPVLLAR
ncbi:MAG: universal stress protein [Gammaproteobacteria bacterium]|nr:universal stress protein [Gammaproteobacteria bacterium]MDH5512326.1 universal stress protein [Gammaproteobacteria bacterium]